MKVSDYNAFIRLAEPNPSSVTPNLSGPLANLTFASKANIEICGWPLTCGASSPIVECCRQDAELVTRLKQSGAAFIGSTNMDELALTMTGFNEYFGNTLNPSQPELICGGSSSGTAAAAAGSLCNFAIGTDFGGSLRFPAAACEVLGLKITAANLNRGVMLLDPEFDSIGVTARNLEVLERVLDCLVNLSSDCTSSSINLILPKGIHEYLEPSIDRSFGEFCTIVAQNCATEMLSLPINFDESHLAWKILAAGKLKRYLGKLPKQIILPPVARAIIKYSDQISLAEISLATKTVATIRPIVNSILCSGKILVTPVIARPIPTISAAKTDGSLGDQIFLTLANLLSLPSLTVPTRLGPILLTGAESSERSLVRAASQVLAQLAL